MREYEEKPNTRLMEKGVKDSASCHLGRSKVPRRAKRAMYSVALDRERKRSAPCNAAGVKGAVPSVKANYSLSNGDAISVRSASAFSSSCSICSIREATSCLPMLSAIVLTVP
jgi:hypothetical protein